MAAPECAKAKEPFGSPGQMQGNIINRKIAGNCFRQIIWLQLNNGHKDKKNCPDCIIVFLTTADLGNQLVDPLLGVFSEITPIHLLESHGVSGAESIGADSIAFLCEGVGSEPAREDKVAT